MFHDLFHLVRRLEHEYREENGKQVHTGYCLRCQFTVQLNDFKRQILRVLHDIDFSIGEPNDKDKKV